MLCFCFGLFIRCQERSQRGYQGDHAPQSSIERNFLREKLALLRRSNTVLSTRSVLWASNMQKNALAAGARPRTPLGSSRCSRCSPTPLSRLGRGTPPPQSSLLSAPRFSRLRRSACVPPNVKSWLRPCSLSASRVTQ